MVYQFAINVIAANALFGIAIPQLKAYNLELEQMVFTDTLTHVSSRQYMVQRAEIEINHSHKQKTALTLVVFDLDEFKLINDQYGHTLGDTTLRKVCKVCQGFLREKDVIARFGGDEFILLFPKLNIHETCGVVEKIRESIHQIKIANTRISSSFGIAELQKHEDFNTLFNRADKALYISKGKGGNRITLADEAI